MIMQLCEGHTPFPDRNNQLISCYYGTHSEHSGFQRRIYRRAGKHKSDSYIVLHYLDTTGQYPSAAEHLAALQMTQAINNASAPARIPPVSLAAAPPATVLPASPQPARLPLPPASTPEPQLLPSTAAASASIPHGALHTTVGAPPPSSSLPPPLGQEGESLTRVVDLLGQLVAARSGDSCQSVPQHHMDAHLHGQTSGLLTLLQGGERGGDSLLHHVTSYGQSHLVQRLLAMGCDANAAGQHGRTPLLVAAQWGHAGAAAALVRGGARLQSTDAHGLDAAQIAEQGGHSALADVFRRCLLGSAGAASHASPAKRSRHADEGDPDESTIQHEHVLQHLEELSLGESSEFSPPIDPSGAPPLQGVASALSQAEAADLLESVQPPATGTGVSADLAQRLQESLAAGPPESGASRSLGTAWGGAGGVPTAELLASLARAPLRERVALHMALPPSSKHSEGGSQRPAGVAFSSGGSEGGTSAEGFSLGGGLSLSGTERGGVSAAEGGYSPQASLGADAAAEGDAAGMSIGVTLHSGVRLNRVASVGSAAHFGLGATVGGVGDHDAWGDSASVSAHSRSGSVFEDLGVSDDEVLGAVEHPPSRPLGGGESSPAGPHMPQWGASAGAEATRSCSVSSDSQSSVSSSATGGGAGGGLSRADALRTYSCMNEEEQAAVEEDVELIQRNVRAWLMLRNFRSLRGAVRTLQAAVRRARDDRRAQAEHDAAQKLQGAFRAVVRGRQPPTGRLEGGVDPKAALALRQVRAALVIQNTLRSRIPRPCIPGPAVHAGGGSGGHEGGVGGAVHHSGSSPGAGPSVASPTAGGGSATGGRKRERDA